MNTFYGILVGASLALIPTNPLLAVALFCMAASGLIVRNAL